MSCGKLKKVNSSSDSNLGATLDISLEGVYYLCKNPEKAFKKAKPKTDIEDYIVYLLDVKLNENNFEDIKELLLQLPRDDITMKYIAKRIMKLAFNGKFTNVEQ